MAYNQFELPEEKGGYLLEWHCSDLTKENQWKLNNSWPMVLILLSLLFLSFSSFFPSSLFPLLPSGRAFLYAAGKSSHSVISTKPDIEIM